MENTETTKQEPVAPEDNASFSEGSLPARVVEATEKLTNLFHIENSLLLERKIAETKDLQNEKAKLSALYQNELLALQQNPACLGPKNSPMRQKLQKVTDAFQEEVKNHGRILLRLKTVSEGLVKSISSEASKLSGAVPLYDTHATVHENTANLPVNIALNQVI